MTKDSSSETTDADSASSYQVLWFKLDKIDKWISGFLFRLSLPPIVEVIYSVPANFFGLVPSLAVGPLWVALLTLEDGIKGKIPEIQKQHSKIILLKGITILLTMVFLVSWILFQKGYMPLTKIMARKIYYLISILFNVGVLSYTLLQLPSDDPYASSSKKAFSHAIYLLFLWPPSILVIVILKEFSRRPRPIVLDMTRDKNSGLWLKKKSFPNICYFLARAQANESFPSGDATAAAIFAIVLVNIAPQNTAIACGLLVLACTGRMYFLAHHFLDVFVGSMLACIIHRVAKSMGFGIYDMVWWHPLVSTTFLAIYVQTIMKNKQKIA